MAQPAIGSRPARVTLDLLPKLAAQTLADYALLPLLAVGGAVVLGLLVLSSGYGFHRDELYFIVAGQHPAFGYVDQPPLTPLLSALSVSLFGLSPTAIRLLPALSAGLIVMLTGALARELGGSTRAQLLAAITTAISGVLAEGHLDSTATYDLLAWVLILWLIARLMRGADPRLWLAVGLVAGIGLENKDTPLFLGAGLVAGFVLTRRWDVLTSRWAWAAVALAALIWAPNLAWQAANGFPQLAMAHAIAGDATENRAVLFPMLLLFAGPLLFPISIVGLGWLLRARAAAPWRGLGIAFPVVLALVLASGGKFYYAAGFVPLLIAAGSLVLDSWLARGRARLRSVSFGGAAVSSGVLMALIVLPILSPATLASTPIPTVYDSSAEQIGWPAFVSTVSGVVETLTPAERAHAVILTSNYGEAASLELLGTGLPPVYSGHNGYWDWGPPAADRTTVVLVGWPAWLGRHFQTCQTKAWIDNGYGIDNQEQGQFVSVCKGLTEPWTDLWPVLRHLD